MENIAVAVILSSAVSVVTLCLVIFLLLKREQVSSKDPPETNCSSDFEEWASNSGLTLDTVRVLKDEGFTSMRLLNCLTSDPVTENLLKDKLPLAQKAALTAAITKLRGDSVLTEVKQSAMEVVKENNLEVVRPPHDIKTGFLNSEGETLTFLMVGKTGTGKSTTGNTILGGDFFESNPSFTSVTSVCELQRNTRNGVTIEIMDCPGLFDTSKSHESIATVVVKSVGGMHPGPHAILLVVRIGRFTEEEENSYTRLMALFDERLAKYTILVFTGGDAIRSSDSFEEMIAANKKLLSILTTCDNRYVIFNNMASDKEPQVDLLLEKVRALVAKNGGKPYTYPKYFKVAEDIEEEVKKRMTKVEQEILKNKQYVQELEIRVEQVKKDLEREKNEIQEQEKTRKQKEQEEEEMRREQVESLKRQLEHMKRDNWSQSADLTPDTVKHLRKEDFTSLRLLRHLTPDLLSTNFQNRLPLAQYVALTAALEDLRQESSTVEQSERRESVPWDEEEDGHENFFHKVEKMVKKVKDTTEAWQNSFNFDPSSSKMLRFFLMGKTGGGKSATGNTILGEPLFDAGLCFSSVTSSCYYHSRKRNGITIEITNSPGLCDTKTSEEDTAGKVVQAVACMHPGPTAFLYVIGIGRYTEEDEGVYKRIKSLFDDRITGYIIIIFTRGDQLKRQNKTMEDVLSTAPDSLRKALGECDNRYVVFDNMADNKQPQVDCLLQLVRKMSEDNGWKPYTCLRTRKSTST